MSPTDAELAAFEAETAVQAAKVAVEAAKPKPEPNPWQDPSSPMYRALVSQEDSFVQRLSPLRNRWPAVARFDERVGELARRRGEIANEINDLRERVIDATNADRQALADWTLNGGDRPLPTVPALEERIVSLEAEADAAALAISHVLAEKADYVVRHRNRLLRSADKATDQAAERCLRLIDELEEARKELYENRCSALWASLYPSEHLLSLPPEYIAGGLRKPIAEAIPSYGGSLLTIENVTKMLRSDVAIIRDVRTRNQHAALLGDRPEELEPGATVWAGTPEANEQARKEKREALERYRREWGHYPREY
jgi:hypothetical protein